VPFVGLNSLPNSKIQKREKRYEKGGERREEGRRKREVGREDTKLVLNHAVGGAIVQGG
jgi:hypothetical protein